MYVNICTLFCVDRFTSKIFKRLTFYIILEVRHQESQNLIKALELEITELKTINVSLKTELTDLKSYIDVLNEQKKVTTHVSNFVHLISVELDRLWRRI